MEYVSLMEVDSDEGFKLPPLYFLERLCGDVDEHVQHLQEHLVSVAHDLLVVARGVERNFSVCCPQELDPQDANLQGLWSTMVKLHGQGAWVDL